MTHIYLKIIVSKKNEPNVMRWLGIYNSGDLYKPIIAIK